MADGSQRTSALAPDLPVNGPRAAAELPSRFGLNTGYRDANRDHSTPSSDELAAGLAHERRLYQHPRMKRLVRRLA